MKAKRIWAILLSLAVLIGVMPMAGLMIGATEETTDGLISIDKGDTDAVFTDAAGTVNVTAPSGKLPYAVSEDGKTVYVANNKTTIGSDKTPVTDYVNTQYTDWGCFDNNGSYLVNTYNKLTQDKELNVVYFGGSLTAGYGCGVAGDPNGVTADGVKEDTHSWRGLSGKWLQQNFPNAAINLVNCAIGESGTYLGTYRVQNDIIAAQPDLLFIEYAINDNYSEDFGTDKAAAKRQLETIVREVKSALPTCDIVIVLTTDINQMATTYSGGFFDQAAGHYELAEAYGLPVMNIGLGLAKNIAAIENNETWWTDYWTDKAIWGKYFCDFVHPYSTGHEQYFLCVEEFLENNLLHTDFDGMSATATYYPPVVSENLFDGNRVTLFGTEMQSAVDTANSTGVSYNSGVVPGGLGSSQSAKAGYYSVAADGSITINFTGTEIALWNNLASGGTTYTYSIDGGTEQTLAKSEHSPTVFAKDLPSKAHTLTVSANAAMYIVGIFSRDAAAQTVQGTAFTYADGRKPMTLTLPEGDYTLGYAATVGELPLPTLDDDATFFGWSTDGELLADTAALPVGATLKATDSSMVKTVYVSGTSGADTNDGTEATPFASLSAAMAAIIAEQDDYYAGEIVILDSVTASSTDAFGATNWTIPVTVKGSAAANTLTLASKLYLYGDTTFDNITVATNGETIYARRNAIHFTSSSKITGSGEVTLGLYNPVYDPAGTVPHKLTLEGTVALNSVNLASYEALGSTAGRYVAGIDFVHNANGAPNWLYVGGRGEYDSEAANRGAAYFTDDVNMTINTAMPNSQFALERRVYVTTQFNGHALQLIYNNGSFVENNLNAGSFTPLDKAHVVAAGGTWYLLKAAAGGGMLSATETAGTYAVSEGWIAIAKQNGTEVARSKGGLLTVPEEGDYDVTWEIEPIEGTLEIYVDGNDGNDGNDGLTSAKAVKTLAQAMTLIRTSPYTAGKINVVGDYTTTSANEFGTTQVAKPVTVSGSGTNTLTLSGDLYLYGDTTFDNIVMATAVSAQSSTNIFANHHTIHFTSTAKITGALPCLVLGSNTSAAASTAHSVTLDTGTFQSAVLGSYFATGNPAVPGVNYVQNNGSAVSGYVYVGSYGSAADAGVTYTDDVNIVINAKTNARFVFDRKRDVVKTTFQNGAALQFVFNHNSHQDQNLENNIATLATSIDETTITDAGGSLYVLKCAAGGGMLSATETAGTYAVSEGWIAIAKQNGTEVARSKGGLLTVPEEGDYDVTWEIEPIEGTLEIYVDGNDGNDGNDGLTSAKAVKTLAQAMTLIRTSPYTAGKINVVGDYTTTSANEFGTTQVAKPVTVSGSGTNTLTLSGDLYLYGDTTFDNIVMATAVSAQSSTNIFANHHTIHFTSTAKITGALPCLVLGSNTSAAASTAHSVTLDTGTFQSAVLGSYFATGNPAVPGVNYVQNNGSAVSGYVYVGSYGSAADAGVTYTDDVNIVINAKTNARFVFDRKRDVVKTTFQNGAALQFVFNHNSHQDHNLENNIATLATSIDETTITDASGSLYVLKCAAGGSTLSIVDKGVYKVADAKNWEAVAKQNGVEIARSNDGVLTVPAAGIYDISWEVPKFDGTMTLYVDATNGSDGNDGSAEEPFATLEKAIAFADSAQAKGAIINIVGMLTNPAAPSGDANYTTPVVIQGANGTASSINLTADWTLSTSVTLQNITLNMEEKAIYAHRNSLTIDSSVVINNGGYLYGGVHHSISSYVYTTPYVMTVNGGTFKDAFVGNYITHPGVPNARKAPRADFVLNGGTIGKLWLGINSYNYNNNCSDHHGGNIYTDDVTITINGGTITGGITVKDSIELDNCQSTPENQNHQPTSFEGNALQIILNNGNTVSVLPTAAEVEAKNGQLYVLRCAEGVSLTRTDETGVFNVSAPEGKIVCAMVGNKPAAIAEDGKLTINSAGDYNVVCMDSVPYTISADGKTLTLHQDLELDFNTILPGGTANDLFLGWYNGDDPAIGVLPAGSTLTAKFIKDWNVDENDDGKGDNFFMVGASLREAKGDKTQALRMITQINKSLLSQIPGDVEYGTVLLPNDILSINDLVKGGSYTYNSKQYSAVTVVGEKTFRDTSDFVQYTAALVNIKASSYMTAYAARAYITYTDANGIERTVYVNDTIASSLNEVAEIMIENAASTDNVDAAKAIVAAAKEHVLSKYEKVQLESDMLLSGSSTELHTDIQNSGQYVAADGTVIEYFKLDNGGRYNDTSVITAPTVREITIDAVSGDGATPTVITQLTDFHINYCNEEDIAENNQWTMSSWANRDAMNPCKGGLHYTIAWHRTAMEYATAVSDQMVLTGDIIDYVSHGNFEMVDRYIKQPYSNALMALGNHEPVRVMGLPTDPNDTDPTPRADYYAMLQKVWTNDVYYTSKVLNNEVMVIQLDNSAGNFTNAQVGLLTADLITARENAYTVLVFAHTPFKADSVKLMGNTGFDDGMTLPEAGSTDPTRSVYDLFIEYSDVMRGFFVGHEHSDIYGELTGTKNGEPVSVPQFALSANFGSFGNILQINVQ